jgi:hypothetical protein
MMIVPRNLWSVCLLVLLAVVDAPAQPQFELANNWITNVSFITGSDRGVEQNLDDNFGWMQAQGYTHLRFFGIYPNGVHIFPSLTLDLHGYPNSVYHEALLGPLVTKASQFGITINFDGWEVIAESNLDTTHLGFGYIDPQELAAVVGDVLAFGVPMISEEQFGGDYLRAIDSVTTEAGAIHETTAGIWWSIPGIADEQLGSVFSFYPRDQAEADSIAAISSVPANVGNLHIWAEGAHYYSIPFSVAVGSFGTMNTDQWKNVLLFAQIQHRPERFSIEETHWDFLVWDSTFNFMDHVGDEIIGYADRSFGERPVANLVYDAAALGAGDFRPAVMAALVNGPAIVNSLTSLGYRVIATVDSILPSADAYYLQLIGGADPVNIAPLPDYVAPLLHGSAPVFLHPTLGIPDDNDAADWIPVRQFFGLPAGETATLQDVLPISVVFDGYALSWAGARLYITPRIEAIAAAQVESDSASVVLSARVSTQDVALVVQHGNKVLINSNVIHLEAAYVLSSLLSGPMNVPTGADVAVARDQTLIFAEYDTDVDVDLAWAGWTHVTHRDPQGEVVMDADTGLARAYTTRLTRGELVVLARIPGGLCGDANDDLVINASDIIYLVTYLFRSGPEPVYRAAADMNDDGKISTADVIYLVGYVFKSGPEPACVP